ncbi:MAG: heme ABC exporter ATP-binding protein CcmA [Pacificimonas sp.]
MNEVSPSGSLLTVTSLRLVRGGVDLLSDISLSVRPGELIRLTGPNGSGKTSLLKVLAGLDAPDEGTVERSSTTAYLGHANGLDPEARLGEELRFWTGGDGEAVPDFGMSPLKHHVVGRLSQGQQRRAALWCLAAKRAELWLMDEPDAALDAASARILSDVLAAHLDGGGAAIVASHGALLAERGERLDLGGQDRRR